jgi:hypothetical protein
MACLNISTSGVTPVAIASSPGEALQRKLSRGSSPEEALQRKLSRGSSPEEALQRKLSSDLLR